METKKTKKTNPQSLFLVGICALVVVNILFLIFSGNEAKTTVLLQNELKTLKHDESILSSSAQIFDTYKEEINVVSKVFPNEETIPEFIQLFETEIRRFTDEYSLKFSSVTPLKEQNHLFLPMTITMKTDFQRLMKFFSDIETLPYMLHVNSFILKTPDDFAGANEVIISLKLYVQNPFNNK